MINDANQILVEIKAFLWILYLAVDSYSFCNNLFWLLLEKVLLCLNNRELLRRKNGPRGLAFEFFESLVNFYYKSFQTFLPILRKLLYF